MENEEKNNSELITVRGILSGAINGVSINGTVTGTADIETGRVTNIFHNIDPEIGQELSSIGIGQTIVCAHMAVEIGSARNLNSIAPMQTLKRLATFKLSSHSMECLQTVAWTAPNEAVVTMEYSGSLPKSSNDSLEMPDMQCEFKQSGPENILQSGTTQAPIGRELQDLSVEIKYAFNKNRNNENKIAWSSLKSQYLENAKNKSSYDETTKEITYNTYVRMLEA
jgi:hypothetical protein